METSMFMDVNEVVEILGVKKPSFASINPIVVDSSEDVFHRDESDIKLDVRVEMPESYAEYSL